MDGVKDIHEKAVRLFKRAFDHVESGRRESLDDKQFALVPGNQWPAALKTQRESAAPGNGAPRPCLEMNVMPVYIAQVVNEQRQNRPSIKIKPFDNGADKATADVYQGLIRHIEHYSRAHHAYDMAFQDAVVTGEGYIRVLTKYVDDDSDEQEICIEPVSNFASVYLDPDARKPDRSDAKWGFIIDRVHKDDFKEMYPKADVLSWNVQTLSEAQKLWCDDEYVQVAEYFEVQFEQRKGRDPKRVGCKWYKLCGSETLEDTDIPSKWVPIIPVYGNEVDLNGTIYHYGIVRLGKDAQRQRNYLKSAQTERVALAPKAPYVGAAGQFEGHAEWADANVRSYAYLEYNPISLNGTLAPPPQRTEPVSMDAGLANLEMAADNDIRATMGVTLADIGAPSNEKSGKAILARQNASNTTNFHYSDNMTRGLEHLGRIVVYMIPKIYDTPRVVRILGEDGTHRMVGINGAMADGQQQLFELSQGRYDVVVEVGPSFATRRQEAAESMLAFVQAFPLSAEVAGDLMAQNMDWPGADEIAERLRKLLEKNMPGIVERKDENGNPIAQEPQMPPELMAQIQQMEQAVQELQAALAEANDKRAIEEMKISGELAKTKMETDAEIEAARISSKSEIIEQVIQAMPAMATRINELMQAVEDLRAQVPAEPVEYAETGDVPMQSMGMQEELPEEMPMDAQPQFVE